MYLQFMTTMVVSVSEKKPLTPSEKQHESEEQVSKSSTNQRKSSSHSQLEVFTSTNATVRAKSTSMITSATSIRHWKRILQSQPTKCVIINAHTNK